MKKILLLSFFLVLTLLNQAMAQDRTISGTVIDKETNTGLPGVTVAVKGTPTVATSTDINGAYTLSVPATATALEFSFIGYRKVERTIGSESSISLTLEPDAKELGEVVVTALGLEKEKRSLGYATQELDTEEITQGRDRSVLNSIQGKVAGVQITSQSGGVGSSTRVVIRGTKSFGGNNQALFVVDGIPIDNSSINTGDALNNGVDAGNRANDINPEDVESMNILKGPAAVALYGSRAANGAIIITTKKGKDAASRNKKAEITLSSSYVFENVLKLPDFQNEFGQGFFGGEDLRENTSWGPKFDGVVRPWGSIVNNQQRLREYNALPDNVKEFYETGSVFTNTLSLDGGNETSSYRISLSDLKQKGVVPNTEYNRNTVSFSGSTKLTNKFNSTASITYTKSGGDLAISGQGNSVFNQLIQTPRNISILELKDYMNPFNDLEGYYSPFTENPYWILNENKYTNDVNRLLGNVQLGYDLNDNFKIMGRIGTDFYNDRRFQFVRVRDAEGINAGYRNNDGEIVNASYFVRELTSDIMASYNKDLTEDLNLNVLVGHNINQRETSNLSTSATQLAFNTRFDNLSNNSGTYTSAGSRTMRRLYGIYSTVDLGFRDYLFLGLTARNDWSSTLPKENRSFFYPSVNTSFVFTEALGLTDNNIISFGKIRANYAQVGLDAPVYVIDPVFRSGNITDGYQDTDLDFPLGGVAGYEQGNVIGNPNLQPEITKSWEVGADMRFFDDRVNLDVSYYSARHTEQIVAVPVAPSSGYTAQYINTGLMTNKGIELLLSVTPIRTNDFNWTISANYTKNKNKVEELFGDTKEISIQDGNQTTLSDAALIARVGEPYGSFRVQAYRRDPQGRIVVGEDGLPLYAAENIIKGNIQPDYLAGLTNTFSYKNLTLNVVFDTKQGGEFYSRTASTMRFAGTDPLTLYNDRNPFVIPNSVVASGDNFVENTVPITNNTLYQYWGNLPQETNIIDASYVKLREVSLRYVLPSNLLGKLPFGNVELGISGRNLLIWTPDENTYVDPEQNTFGNGNIQGYDFSGSPTTRSYGANIRVTF